MRASSVVCLIPRLAVSDQWSANCRKKSPVYRAPRNRGRHGPCSAHRPFVTPFLLLPFAQHPRHTSGCRAGFLVCCAHVDLIGPWSVFGTTARPLLTHGRWALPRVALCSTQPCHRSWCCDVRSSEAGLMAALSTRVLTARRRRLFVPGWMVDVLTRVVTLFCTRKSWGFSVHEHERIDDRPFPFCGGARATRIEAAQLAPLVCAEPAGARPINLKSSAMRRASVTSYGWVDQNAGCAAAPRSRKSSGSARPSCGVEAPSLRRAESGGHNNESAVVCSSLRDGCYVPCSAAVVSFSAARMPGSSAPGQPRWRRSQPRDFASIRSSTQRCPSTSVVDEPARTSRWRSISAGPRPLSWLLCIRVPMLCTQCSKAFSSIEPLKLDAGRTSTCRRQLRPRVNAGDGDGRRQLPQALSAAAAEAVFPLPDGRIPR